MRHGSGTRHARFLAEKGEGVHHVAVATSNFDETVAQADRRNGVILCGESAAPGSSSAARIYAGS